MSTLQHFRGVSRSLVGAVRRWLKTELTKRMETLEANLLKTKSEKDGDFESIGNFKVFAWSISGIETSVVVKAANGFACCFDMGYASRASVRCDTVLISHGHLDHISAVPQHIKKRELTGGRPATYYVPENLVHPLKEVSAQFASMNGNNSSLRTANICGCKPGDTIKLSKGFYAKPFPTVHRVESQGYILYRQQKSLKPDLVGLPAEEIRERVRSGEEVNVVTEVPEVAFTGDTTFEVFSEEVQKPPPDLFKVNLLIVEATYINDDKDKPASVEQARKWGHIHLSELYDNAELFKDVGQILLIHFSDKYSVSYIQDKVYATIPEILADKVKIATLAKERYL